jgi:hypothetical protein
MSDVIKYTAVSATNDVEDRYDGDFFPMEGVEDDFYDFSGLDTDGDGIDAEFSEVLGGLFKKKSSAPRLGGSQQNTSSRQGGLFGGKLKGLISGRREGLDDRLANREERIGARQDRRTKRADARERRRNLRQVALVKNNTPQVQLNIEKIVNKNAQNTPQLRESVNLTAEGLADTVQEQQTQVVVREANNMAAAGNDNPPIIDVDVTTGTVTEVKDTWWKKQSTGVKVAIIGGGILALGVTVWGITKLRKK